jgi:hypothetical protein
MGTILLVPRHRGSVKSLPRRGPAGREFGRSRRDGTCLRPRHFDPHVSGLVSRFDSISLGRPVGNTARQIVHLGNEGSILLAPMNIDGVVFRVPLLRYPIHEPEYSTTCSTGQREEGCPPAPNAVSQMSEWHSDDRGWAPNALAMCRPPR